MTDDELIARLRSGLIGVDVDKQAADRIEALTAKVKLMDDLDAINGEKIEALEAKLAKAVEAFEEIKRYSSCGDTRRKAIETLAEIKGESHD